MNNVKQRFVRKLNVHNWKVRDFYITLIDPRAREQDKFTERRIRKYASEKPRVEGGIG